jgi:acyl carrier protein
VYRPNFEDGHANLAVARFSPREQSPHVVFGAAMFLDYVFGCWNFRKLYMEVQEFNLDQFGSGLAWLFEEEGRLRAHTFFGGRYWDKIYLALYREKWQSEGWRARGARPRTTAGSDTALQTGTDSGATIQDGRSATLEEFAAAVSSVSGADTTSVVRESRLVEDLGLDSLEIAELVLILEEMFHMRTIGRAPEAGTWTGVTVGDLFDEYLTGRPAARVGGA